MARRMVGLHKHPKNGGYWFKRGIPERLRPFFPERGQTWNENLKTKDEREARLRHLDVAHRVERLFQQAERTLLDREQARSVSPAVVTGLVSRWRERESWKRAEMVMQGDPMPGWPAFIREAQLVDLPGYKPKNEEPEAFARRIEARSQFVNDAVDEICREAALLLPNEHPARHILGRMVGEAWRSVLILEERWRAHDFTDLPTMAPADDFVDGQAEATLTPMRSHGAQRALPPRLSDALEAWKNGGGAHNAKVPQPRTALEATTAVRRFIEVHGDLHIHLIQKHHARELRELLAQVPTTLTAKQRELPLRKIIELRLQGRRPTAQTLNKQMNLLSAVLSHADREGHFDGQHWTNPFRLQLRLADEAMESFEPFTVAELKKLIASPVFAAGERPKRGRGETAKWAPLMALFHGMRRGEVLQLLVNDVRKDEDSEVWFIDVRPELEAGKRVKNRGSKRRVAIHAEYIKLGFLDFVEERRRSVGGAGSLWPGFEDRSKLASRSNRWAEWFHGYLAEHVVDAETKKFHSFRGAFKRFGEECASAAIIKRVMGHALVGVSDTNYGRLKDESGERDHGVSLARMATEVAKVRFGDLSFDTLR